MNGHIPSEEQEQRTVTEWLDLHKVFWCHVPNGGDRNVIVARKLKLQGVKRGVPDILIFDSPPSNPDFKGVAIELKRRKGGKVGPYQAKWLDRLERRKWYVSVCRGAGEAIGLLEKLGY